MAELRGNHVPPSSKRSLETRLANGVLLVGQGYLHELERRGYITAGSYVPEVVLEAPAAVSELHREFLNAGSDILVALTYYASRNRLESSTLIDRVEELHRTALRLAKQVAEQGDALVAADVCHTEMYDTNDPGTSAPIVRAMFEEQIGWAVEEGADLLVSESNHFLGEALIALEVANGFKLPAVVTLASYWDTTRDGFDYPAACKILEDHGAAVVGVSCKRGPATLLPLAKEIRAAVDGPLAALAVPFRTSHAFPTFQHFRDEQGNPLFPLGLERFACTRSEMAEFAQDARSAGVNYIGICCGGAPYHLRAMAEALGRTVPASKHSPRVGSGCEYRPPLRRHDQSIPSLHEHLSLQTTNHR